METAAGQKALIRVWAEGSTFVYNDDNQPKAEFARLAKVMGWEGGDASWCSHWEACFGKPYSYGRNSSATSKMTIATQQANTTSAQIITDRMHRLSLASDASSFSLISVNSSSSCPSVVTLDSTDSTAGGVVLVGPVVPITTKKKKKSKKSKQTSQPSSEPTTAANATSAAIAVTAVAAAQSKSKNKTISTDRHVTAPAKESKAAEVSPFWKQFRGFEPSPRANFKEEFSRLAKHQGWGTKTKRKRQPEALTSEVAFHCGTCMTKLDRWQELCEELGLEKIPNSITKCKKELQKVFVNLFNFIDHRRNPEVKIIHFKSYAELCKNIRAGNKFPRQCAKQDGFISVLLKRI